MKVRVTREEVMKAVESILFSVTRPLSVVLDGEPIDGNINKIDVTKLRGRWTDYDPRGRGFSSGDDTNLSLRIIAEKVNEIIELLNSQSKQ